MGTNERRNQLLNEIITVRDYRETQREEGADRQERGKAERDESQT